MINKAVFSAFTPLF